MVTQLVELCSYFGWQVTVSAVQINLLLLLLFPGHFPRTRSGMNKALLLRDSGYLHLQSTTQFEFVRMKLS